MGIKIIDPTTEETISVISPKLPAKSFDDIAISDGYLFALDARGDGFLMVFSLENPTNPQHTGSITSVPVEPYCGVSAQNGNVVISGGTKHIAHHSYDLSSGLVSNKSACLERDRGHPDISLSTNGKTAYVSTHFGGPEFGILSIKLNEIPNIPTVISEFDIAGAGFTGGTFDHTGFPIKSIASDSVLYVAHGNGLSIYNITDNSISETANIDLGIEAMDVCIYKNKAYVIGINSTSKLVIVNIENSIDPSIIETISLSPSSQPASISVSETTMAITYYENSVEFFPRQ